MPPPETMFCSQQINIPTGLPEVLKNFTKAAIRTQPKDLLMWSAAYFEALAKGETLPVKERLEMNFGNQSKDAMLTPGLLKTLHKQLSSAETCGREELQDKWKALCLPTEQLENMLILGNFGIDISCMEFFALGCSALGDVRFVHYTFFETYCNQVSCSTFLLLSGSRDSENDDFVHPASIKSLFHALKIDRAAETAVLASDRILPRGIRSGRGAHSAHSDWTMNSHKCYAKFESSQLTLDPRQMH
ncbi:ropporin-1-like protein isoform X1 [Phyllopteryx taeniolatus]|uniref:ropporin-1-like protein isoform X1 n=1 Tax=Phyllopteryx taeniolatus TaxID=161469 RepID=UPI002AD24E5C|nr:ropporin-1-like protein isoform X1 [Phyllopteryx taeniolatus]XP_061614064.1 ropporin-1-like protein isoform X1 [Phyllopteryx taeniolatus]